MVTTKHEPTFADALISIESALNDLLQLAEQQGAKVRIEAYVTVRPNIIDHVHFRMVTPEIENDSVSG